MPIRKLIVNIWVGTCLNFGLRKKIWQWKSFTVQGHCLTGEPGFSLDLEKVHLTIYTTEDQSKKYDTDFQTYLWQQHITQPIVIIQSFPESYYSYSCYIGY